MATKKIKINFKMPTPTAAERLHAQQQKNRKAAGLPDSSEYKKKLDSMKSEEVEQLDEISDKLKASYVSGAKKQIKQSMPFTKKSDEYRDIAKNFIAKRQKGIAKATKVEEQLEKKGRFVSGPIKQPFKSNTIVTSVKEGISIGSMSGRGNIHNYDRNPPAKDGNELENVPFHAKTEKQKKLQNALNDLGKKMKETHPKLKEDLGDKITVFKKDTNIKQKISSNSYDTFKHHGFRKEEKNAHMDEEVKKNEYHISKKHKFPTPDEHAVTVKHTESGREHVHTGKGKYLSKLIKSRYNINHYFEEVELTEGRPSQRHPLEGHEYHKKSDEALVHIAKDAHAAAEAMKGHNTQAENKYRDQANDSATVRYFRKKSGMPDWYKKKYGHVKEDADPCWKGYKMVGMKDKNGRKVPNCVPGEGVPSMKKEDAANPTEGEMKGKQQGVSRKAQIVMNAAKGKKSDNPDKFQKDPELSSEIHKT